MRMRGFRSGAVAASVALTAAAAFLVPAALSDEKGGDGDSGRTRGADHRELTAADESQAAEDTCDTPEASLRPSAASGAAIERIKKNGRLIAGVDQNSFRWGYRDPATRKLTGFDIDLVRAIAADILGDPDAVTYRAIPTNQRIPALKEGKVDVVVRTMTINCRRIEDVAFSTAYFQAGQQVLAPKESPVTGYDDTLRGRKVCTAKGSTAEAALKEDSHGATVVPPLPNQLDCLVRLQLGEVDAVITDNALAAGQAAQDPAVELKGKPFTTELYGVAMNKDDKDLVRRVNKVLDDYRRGGKGSRWMRAYDKWLAKDLGEENPTVPHPKYRD
ncbi:glutamate ABC transporter substrate-binding protein [Streptomyces sp. XD-27]|uniref:glutamate ABC transporter substrate-binding protein n=1 Tax=Streptomyces sp. XD-27 TaxID=3062779 RepID=UPI0026F4180A|nr:glutamate ABC transporter substrate-binding protein [Streptomyces sp. XD-27]WKX70357.1 glutamate ABC transporter substrate-binding protein [Streptomyces sp. XD-27]